MLRIHTCHRDVTACHCGGNPPCGGDDAVADDPVFGGIQPRHAHDRHRRRARALDLGTHLIQHRAEVDDVRLACGVVNRRNTLGQYGGHPDVLGCSDRRELQLNLGAAQHIRLGHDTTVLDVAVSAQLSQAGLVHVQRARPDGVSAGQGDLGSLAAADQRSQHTHRRAELTDRGEIRVVLGFVGRGDPHRGAVQLDVCAQSAQDLGHQWHVEYVRAVGNRAGALGQQRGRHQLQYAVFGSPDSNFARQPAAASHHESLAHADQCNEPSYQCQSARYGLTMAVHLTRIYTRTGDDGTTGLSDFSRVSKNDARLQAYADCDETNAAIGVAIALGNPGEQMTSVLRQIQNDLFDAGADLSTPVVEKPEHQPLRITQSYVDRLESWCDQFNEPLPALDSVALARGAPVAAVV